MPLSYEALDTLADTYIPVIGVMALVLLYQSVVQKIAHLKSASLYFFVTISIVYTIKLIDDNYHVWHQLELDYSTHTALSVSLICFILKLSKKYSIGLLGSLLGYFSLMHYQQYHTLYDMLTTLMAILILNAPFLILLPIKTQSTSKKSGTKISESSQA